MPTSQPFTVLCLASYEKGQAFLRQVKAQGCRVFLLTSLSLKDTADWPRESIDELFYMPDQPAEGAAHTWSRQHTLHAVAHLLLEHRIDRIVALDEFDLELAAWLRAHLSIGGMDETTTRRFRDKLAMRRRAEQAGLPVPPYTGVLNRAEVSDFLERTPGPWVLKPRFMAGAIGIQKHTSATELRAAIEALGDQQSYYLIERFVPGDVFHVDTVLSGGAVLLAVASGYGSPPLAVAQGGGIFTTQLLPRGTPDELSLRALNAAVLAAMGHTDGVAHTEFIRASADQQLYFLETAARVGGAHIADLVEAATGVNLWAEWARIESGQPYHLPATRQDYAGLLVSLARQEWPDTSMFTEPEIVWRMHEPHHIGLIVRSPNAARVSELLGHYTLEVQRHFHAALPPQDRPTH